MDERLREDMLPEIPVPNIHKSLRRLKREDTFRELEYYIKRGSRVLDLLLIVPKDIKHSGTVQTKHGDLMIITNNYITEPKMKNTRRKRHKFVSGDLTNR